MSSSLQREVRKIEHWCGQDLAQLGDRTKGCGSWLPFRLSCQGLSQQGCTQITPEVWIAEIPSNLFEKNIFQFFSSIILYGVPFRCRHYCSSAKSPHRSSYRDQLYCGWDLAESLPMPTSQQSWVRSQPSSDTVRWYLRGARWCSVE